MHQNVFALRCVARVSPAQQPLGAVVDGVARQMPARVVHGVDMAHDQPRSLHRPRSIPPIMRASIFAQVVTETRAICSVFTPFTSKGGVNSRSTLQ